MKSKKTIENRLEVGDELFCFDGITLMEKVSVISVDKKEKTATLSNQVVCKRYPNYMGQFPTVGHTKCPFTITNMDEGKEKIIKAKIAKQKVIRYMSIIQSKVLERLSNILKAKEEDLDLIIELEKAINKSLSK